MFLPYAVFGPAIGVLIDRYDRKKIMIGARRTVNGCFSVYSSKSSKDFIHESNKGKDIFFLPDEKQAVKKLSTD